MPGVRAPARSGNPSEPHKTDWVLIEGNGRTVLKTIAGILRRTGDNHFAVEFRIFQSSHSPEGHAQQRERPRRRGLGSLTSIFIPKRKRRR